MTPTVQSMRGLQGVNDMRAILEAARSGQPFTLSGAGWRLILEMEPRPERNETVLLKEVMEYLQAILDNSQCMSVKEQ